MQGDDGTYNAYEKGLLWFRVALYSQLKKRSWIARS
jgi:hypothetical protein